MYINSLNDEMKRQYGRKMYKLSLSGGMTCPNRDGTVGSGGCIFCSGGSGSFSEDRCEDIRLQLDRAKARLNGKDKGAGYIAYFQSFTNTYADTGYLRKLFFETVEQNDVDILSVATRPDCLEDEKIELLCEINRIKPVWVELGFQTSREDTAKYIRRGYENAVFDDAVKRLQSAGIKTICHMIIGLPGENGDDAVNTARYIARCGVWGIKFHLLHVLRGTDLEKDYAAGKFECLSMERYTDILLRCIRAIPKDMVIHRMTGDGDKRELLAPLWSGDKKRVLNYINKRLRDENVVQGEERTVENDKAHSDVEI